MAAATGATPETGEDDRNCEESGSRCWDCPALVLGTCTADSCALMWQRCFTVIHLTFWEKCTLSQLDILRREMQPPDLHYSALTYMVGSNLLSLRKWFGIRKEHSHSQHTGKPRDSCHIQLWTKEFLKLSTNSTRAWKCTERVSFSNPINIVKACTSSKHSCPLLRNFITCN